MEIEQHDHSFIVDNPSPAAKRRKLDNGEPSSPQKPKGNIFDKCPIMSLPIDLLANIIDHIAIAQWHALELVDKNFREATLHAWRQLRHVDLGEFIIVSKKMDDESALERDIRAVTSIIGKLNNRSPFLTTLHGVSLQTDILGLNLSIIACLARFEHLESISFFEGHRYTCAVELGCPIQDLNFFLETSRSRATLKELIIESCYIEISPEFQRAMDISIRRFSHLVSDDRGTREPLKLEKFSTGGFGSGSMVNFDFMDLSRMAELHFGLNIVKPEQLTSMIIRAPNLERLRFAFLHCNSDDFDCGGNGLRNNLDLLKAISSREKLKALEFDSSYYECDDGVMHEDCMRFESEFLDMLKDFGRRGVVEKLSFFDRDFVWPEFDMSLLIATISEHLPRLRAFTVPIVDDCNAHDLKTIVKMEYLEELDFLYNGDHQKFHDITEGVFAQLGHHKRLKQLKLGGFAREEERPLDELAKLSTLVDVQIRRVDLVRKEHFVSWSEGHLANLESLTLSGIGVVDKDAEVGLISLIRKAPRLRLLQIEGMITDRLLEAIAESCPKLISLGVASRKREISVAALQKIVDRCPELMELGGMKNDIRKQLTFPKYWKISHASANPWSTDGDDDNDADYYECDDDRVAE